MQPRRPLLRFDKLRQFLDHDRHVLRFNCFWDDTENLYGDARDFILDYFLGMLLHRDEPQLMEMINFLHFDK